MPAQPFTSPFLAIPIGYGAIYESLRTWTKTGALALAMHRPDLAAHIDEMKAATRQFAHGDDITAIDRRPSVGRRVLDLVTVPHVEMLHRCLHSRNRRARPSWTGDRADSSFCCTAQFYAAMHKMQAGVRAMFTAAALVYAPFVLHPFLHVMATNFPATQGRQTKENKRKQISFLLFTFIFSDRDFSMPYG
jgi:hypothetical protein